MNAEAIAVALVTDEAVTLTVSDYSETSQVITLLTCHNGKLRLLAKGSKRPKSRTAGPVDKLQLVQAVFSMRARSGLGQLIELSQRDALPGLRSRLDAFYAASYAAELVLMGTEDLDPHPGVFKMLRGLLRRLSRGGNSAILVYRFEVRLLDAIGLMPQLGVCVSCGRKRPSATQRPAEDVLFSPAAGGLVCRRCRTQGGEALTVGGKALDALAFLAAAGDDELDRVRLAEQTAADMRKLLRAYWPYVLGREPRALHWVT